MPPRGVWAIASDLESATEAMQWADGAACAQAFSFRSTQPQSARISLACLQSLRERLPWLAVHARASWARLVGADALIVGSRGLPVFETQQLWDSSLGLSSHSPDDLQIAQSGGFAFAFASPIWATPSKAGILEPLGLETLRNQVADFDVPLIALGGVSTPAQVAQCAEAGAHGVAVLRAAQEPKLLAEMVDAWRETAKA